jgi:hypothetical protein
MPRLPTIVLRETSKKTPLMPCAPLMMRRGLGSRAGWSSRGCAVAREVGRSASQSAVGHGCGRPVKWLRGPLRGRNQKIANRCHCKPLLAPQRLFERVLFPPLEPGKHPLAPLEILLSRVWRRASASFSRELPLFQIEMREFFEDPLHVLARSCAHAEEESGPPGWGAVEIVAG